MLFWMIIIHLLFGLFFVYTGNWYFCFVPIVVIMSIWLVSSKKHEIPSLKSFYYDNMFIISWFMIIFGVSGLLYYGNTDIIYIVWLIIISNTFLLALSYLQDYEDGKSIFEYWYWMSMIIYTIVIVRYGFRLNDVSLIISLFSFVPIFTASLYVRLLTTIGSITKIPTSMYYKAIFWINCILVYWLIYIFRGDLVFGILGSIGYLTFVSWVYDYLSIYYFAYILPQSIDIKYILKWNKLFDLPPDNYNSTIGNLWLYISSAPYLFQISQNIIITFLMTIVTGYMFWNSLFGQNIYLILYIMSIFLYIYNFYLSQKLKLDIEIQKIYIFFMINLVGYLVLYLLSKDMTIRLAGGLIWNSITSIAIVYYDDLYILYSWNKYINTADFIKLRPQDINYRIASNIVWLVMNIYIIIVSNFDNNIKIFFVLLVVWVWVFLMTYVVKRNK